MKLKYGWAGSVFTSETDEDRQVLASLVEVLKKSDIQVEAPDSDRIMELYPIYYEQEGILIIPGE